MELSRVGSHDRQQQGRARQDHGGHAACRPARGGWVKVVALDADPAGAFIRWAQNTYEGPAFATFAETDEAQLAHLIDTENQTADLVLVDTAGFGNRAAAVAMTSADAVLIPTLAGEADITEAEKTVRLVEGLARAARRDIPARVLLNRVKRTQLARHAAREIESAALPDAHRDARRPGGLRRDDVLGPDPRSGPGGGGSDAAGRGTAGDSAGYPNAKTFLRNDA